MSLFLSLLFILIVSPPSLSLSPPASISTASFFSEFSETEQNYIALAPKLLFDLENWTNIDITPLFITGIKSLNLLDELDLRERVNRFEKWFEEAVQRERLTFKEWQKKTFDAFIKAFIKGEPIPSPLLTQPPMVSFEEIDRERWKHFWEGLSPEKIKEGLLKNHPFTRRAVRERGQLGVEVPRHDYLYYLLFAEKQLGNFPPEGIAIFNLDPHSDYQGDGGSEVGGAVFDYNWAMQVVKDRLSPIILTVGYYPDGSLPMSWVNIPFVFAVYRDPSNPDFVRYDKAPLTVLVSSDAHAIQEEHEALNRILTAVIAVLQKKVKWWCTVDKDQFRLLETPLEANVQFSEVKRETLKYQIEMPMEEVTLFIKNWIALMRTFNIVPEKLVVSRADCYTGPMTETEHSQLTQVLMREFRAYVLEENLNAETVSKEKTTSAL